MLRRIRDLNDEINKLIREKGHWEDRIVELGGPDYAKAAPKVQDSQGFEIQGATGKGAGYRQASSKAFHVGRIYMPHDNIIFHLLLHSQLVLACLPHG